MNTRLILLGLLISTLTLACTNKASKTNKADKVMEQDKKSIATATDQNNTLAALLTAKKTAFEQKASAEKKKIYAEGIADVSESGILDKALNVGDKALDFTLKNQAGESVSLYSELKNGPVVLTWYRGGWCPYCNISLQYLQQHLPDFKQAGASLIALTPELPDESLNTSEKHKLEFAVLSDVGNIVGKEYGVVFKLTKDVAASYHNAFDMHSYNGDDSDELPLAATYVIGKDGIIKYAFLDADYRNRAEPSAIISVLKQL